MLRQQLDRVRIFVHGDSAATLAAAARYGAVGVVLVATPDAPRRTTCIDCRIAGDDLLRWAATTSDGRRRGPGDIHHVEFR